MDDPQSEYDQWVKPIEQRLMRAVWRIVRDPDDADDAFQQALEKIWRQWSRVRRHPNPQALIMTIAINASYDHLRKRARSTGRETAELDVERHACQAPGADRKLADAEADARVQAAISELPKMQRSTVTLRLIGELPYDSIAQSLGCSAATARTHFMRGIQKLRSELAELNPAGGKEEKR